MIPSRTVPFARPWITDEERQAVLEVLEGSILAHGPQSKKLEEEFARFLEGEAYCVSVSSCMAALHLAYFYFGLGPNDEVIVPAQTHTATVHAVELVGAKPIFVDCEPLTGNVDCSKIESLITAKTKAISVVHFLGIPCAMNDVMILAERHGIKVIEDCALAVGARYNGRHVGLIGDVGCFSFYPVKHITTGEGGMFVTRHRGVAERVARLRAFGVDRSHSERAIPGMYDVTELGLNYRMSEIQAAIGRRQLTRIQKILECRGENFKRLKSLLTGIKNVSILDAKGKEASNSYYCLSLVLDKNLRPHRDEIVSKLNEVGVGTSIYYPHPVPRLSYYKHKYGLGIEDYPEAVAISDGSIALPVGPHLSTIDIEYIANCVTQVVKEVHV